MKYSFVPISVIGLPNDFTAIPKWDITNGAAYTLYLQLHIDDALGLRRYIPGSTDTLKLVFMRARSATLGVVDSAQTFEVSCAANTYDRSIWSCALTAAQVALIVSGTVQMKLTSGTNTHVYNKAYAIKKTSTDAGC
jgi:hypothetical protein